MSSWWRRNGVALATAMIVASLSMFFSCGSSQPTREPVVFIGASTIARWPTYTDFPSRNWTAKGVPEETSSEVLLRYDVQALQSGAKAVHIICGINDMSSGQYSEDVLVGNWTKMIESGRAAGMKVFIGTLQPWGVGVTADPVRNAKVESANARLKVIGPQLGATVLDYHEILSAADGTFVPSYTDDGIHPNKKGYALMTVLADRVVR